MKYASIGTVEFRDPDGDILILKSEPTGSQYDERQGLLGSMKIPGNLIDENTNMEDLFANGEMVEFNVDKKKVAEFQFRALFVSMTINDRIYKDVSTAMAQYRLLSRESKEWIDEQCDSVWRKHEDEVASVVRAEGESAASAENSSSDTVSDVAPLKSIPKQ